MDLETQQTVITHQLLEKSISTIERMPGLESYVLLEVRDLLGITKFLAMEDLGVRLSKLIEDVSKELYMDASISKSDELEKTIQYILSVGILVSDKVEEFFPVYREDEIMERIQGYAQNEPHIDLTLKRHYDEAFLYAQLNNRKIEEIASLQAIIGDFNGAMNFIQERIEQDFRKGHVLLVIGVELLRRCRFSEARNIIAQLESEYKASYREFKYLALGAANREPWPDYPFTDW